MTTIEYKGFTIKKLKDCWSGESYFVYDSKGRQMFDGEDSEEGAKEQVDQYLGE